LSVEVSSSPADDALRGRHATFGRNLRRQRERVGLSQEALGDLCDLHRTEISLLERAGREPRLGTIVKLARALKIKPADLLDGIR
jgi:transcriptional regulator with XRE-family HTH domain